MQMILVPRGSQVRSSILCKSHTCPRKRLRNRFLSFFNFTTYKTLSASFLALQTPRNSHRGLKGLQYCFLLDIPGATWSVCVHLGLWSALIL